MIKINLMCLFSLFNPVKQRERVHSSVNKNNEMQIKLNVNRFLKKVKGKNLFQEFKAF